MKKNEEKSLNIYYKTASLIVKAFQLEDDQLKVNIRKEKIIPTQQDKIDDIKINSACSCKKLLTLGKKIFLKRCHHFLHRDCYHLIKENNGRCPICNSEIEEIMTEKEIYRSEDEQLKRDLNSVTMRNTKDFYHPLLPVNLIKVRQIFTLFKNAKTDGELISVLGSALKMANLKINIIDNTERNPIYLEDNTVKWKDDSSNVVIISNHTNEILDSFILFYLFRAGFVSTKVEGKTKFGDIIAKKCNLLTFRRGIDTNLVEKMKEYLDINKKLIVYPEGTISGDKSLIRFRTGAFHLDAPVCPVIIKYKKDINDIDTQLLVLKIISQREIKVDLYINDLFYPPFNDDKIEKVQEFMAGVGHLKRSRVINKDILD